MSVKNYAYKKRWIINQAAKILLALSALLALIPLFSIFAYVLTKGAPALNFEFFTQLPKPVGEVGGGVANAILGTLILTGLASMIGVPWGMSIGLYLSEYGKGKRAELIRFCVDLVASIPSIVIGLFIYVIAVLPMSGFSALAGGVALGILMIPTVARTTEEILKLVPIHHREAGLALGLPRWKVILRIILRGARAPILSGVMLSLARVSGETAPLYSLHCLTVFGVTVSPLQLPQCRCKYLIMPLAHLKIGTAKRGPEL